jgi:hypothetical protein
MWAEGIVDWCFTEEEILQQFEDKRIKIPESFLLDFRNRIDKMKQKRFSLDN